MLSACIHKVCCSTGRVLRFCDKCCYWQYNAFQGQKNTRLARPCCQTAIAFYRLLAYATCVLHRRKVCILSEAASQVKETCQSTHDCATATQWGQSHSIWDRLIDNFPDSDCTISLYEFRALPCAGCKSGPLFGCQNRRIYPKGTCQR